MTLTGSLEPAAIQLTLERLQESARLSSCIFQVSISMGTFVSNSLSLSTTDGTKWTSLKYN